MGASGWSYFVPYEADISAALQRLREDVFARGDYATAEDTIAAMDWEAAAKQNLEWAKNPELPPKTRESYLAAASDYRKRHWAQVLAPKQPPAPKPGSIDELLDHENEAAYQTRWSVGRPHASAMTRITKCITGGVVIVLLLPIFVTTYSGKESREFLEILKEKHPVQDLGLNDATTAG